jgi:hypothetical protein
MHAGFLNYATKKYPGRGGKMFKVIASGKSRRWSPA